MISCKIFTSAGRSIKDLINIKASLIDLPAEVNSAEIVTIAKSYIKPENKDAANKIMKFLDVLEDLDDVQNVYTNGLFT